VPPARGKVLIRSNQVSRPGACIETLLEEFTVSEQRPTKRNDRQVAGGCGYGIIPDA